MIFEQVAAGAASPTWSAARHLRGRADRSRRSARSTATSRSPRATACAFATSIDTHTHADHFSATRELAQRLGVPVVMHRASPAPFVDLRLDDGEMLIVGKLRLQVLHTPGHTRDSMCLCVEDRVFTGDTLLIGGTGRTDLPSGDPEALLRQPVRPAAAARPGAQGLSGARIQGPHPLDHRRGDRRQPAPAEARARRLRRDDAEPRT